uniref:50S ribosomal protein 6, chloroplastic n=1 Tax=Erigeron canadensis TaxID=72917 RepID=UPI001CB8EDEF|nr:50S ribosomal protein 6, chloroplastic [Erigeron canadensis]
MSISAIFGVKITPTPSPAVRTPPTTTLSSPASLHYNNNSLSGSSSSGGLMIECSSRPQKKATAHHRKTRPKKTQPWDRNRGPAVYPPLPALPPEWSFVTNEEEAVTAEGGVSSDSVAVSE